MLESLDMADVKKGRAGRPPAVPGPTKQKGVTLAADVFGYLDDIAYGQRRPTAVLMREILTEWVETHRKAAASALPATTASPKKPRR